MELGGKNKPSPTYVIDIIGLNLLSLGQLERGFNSEKFKVFLT